MNPDISASKPTASVSIKVPPLFRRNDWWALGICFVIVAGIYLYFLSPQVTLEDSGELSTGSFWAGIPHPPGYPFWAIYSWLWTELLPFGNVAWRVEVGDAMAEAMGCSLIAFMVSRGSSMFMESIDELRGIVGKWENAICLVCGVTAGLLMALDDTMWFESEAINRISLFGVPWVILMLLCLMRWIYAPQQRRYLYGAFFFFGISVTIHQSLLVAALGLEIGIAFTLPKLGRDLFFWNAVVWLCLMAAKMTGVWTTFAESNTMVTIIVNIVGIGSIIACGSMAIATGGLLTEIVSCLWMGLLWVAGSSFYFYEAIAGMTNPPMEWGYPRTVEGFFHALTRGQYEKINPTDVFGDRGRFFDQLYNLVRGVADAYSWVYLLFALLPFLFFFKMKKRERNWLIAIAALYPFLGIMMTILLNPSRDKQTADLLKVFFVASHTVVAILLGYGLALTAAYMATNYEKFKLWGWCGGVAALVLACWNLLVSTGKLFFGLAWEDKMKLTQLPHWVAQAFAPGQYGLPVFANLFVIGLALVFLGALALRRTHAPLLLTLGIFAAMPVYSALAHWFQSEQRNHWFGYWYGHDMFTPPFMGPDGKLTYDVKLREAALHGTNAAMVYPEMARDSVLYGGTDPGRFCPTYMIFCESFIPSRCQPEQDDHFNRRDVYLITQNALADPTYLDYIRAQYNRFTQIDPPFFQMLLPTEFPKQFHDPTWLLKPLDNVFESLGAKIERERRIGSSWFKEEDFTDVGKLAAQLRDGKDNLAKFLFGKLSKTTQDLLQGKVDDRGERRALAKDFNVILNGATIYDAENFKNITLPPLILQAAQDDKDQTTSTRVRLNRRMLEEAYPGEIARSAGGVYPDTEIHTSSYEELMAAENDYTRDAAQRYVHDMSHPNESRQVRPGEIIVPGKNGQLSFGGATAVMGINGFVTKQMFDANPLHEFYVEESFPMDWMYSYLTPYGIIMHIDRTPLAQLPEEMVARDHNFWRQYSTRLVGDWVDENTTTKQLCDFAEKIYLRHDYSGFQGDLKFVRDEDAQKDFSKLREAIGGSIYEWRSMHDNSPEDRARMLKEAEFAFKQAFAFCPYGEAAYRYVQLLIDMGRIDDALLVAETFLKLDPFNGQVENMVKGLREAGKPQPQGGMTVDQIFDQIKSQVENNQTNRAAEILNQLLHHPQATASIEMEVADFYSQYLRDFPKAEEAMVRATQLESNSSVVWYDLASLQAFEQKTGLAVESLKKAFAANDVERQSDPKMVNLRENAVTNRNFQLIRQTPEFQALAPGK
jgi:tetratricopeptide (TPR) repeat protein